MTLTRPREAAPISRAAAIPRPPSIAPIRGALVIATFAAACLAVSYSPVLVTRFGGSLATLGAAANYADSAATVLGWLLATAALFLGYLAATELGGLRAGRVGLVVAMIGSVLLAVAGACAVWATQIQGRASISGGALAFRKASSATREIQNLSKAELAFTAAGFLVLGIGALAARAASPSRRAEGATVAAAWRRAFLALGVGFVLAAVAPAYELVEIIRWPSSGLNQLYVLVTTVPPVLAWVAIAVGVLLAGSALRRSPRTSGLAVAGTIGAVGAFLVAVEYGTQVVFNQYQLSSTSFGWSTNLAKVGSATVWAGWLLITLAIGIAAARLTEHDVLARPAVTPLSVR